MPCVYSALPALKYVTFFFLKTEILFHILYVHVFVEFGTNIINFLIPSMSSSGFHICMQ